MKLNPISVGEHIVQIKVENNTAYPHVLFFVAVCCDKTRIENTMTLQGAHDHSFDQFLNEDFDVHVQALANEAAGRCQSGALISQLLR